MDGAYLRSATKAVDAFPVICSSIEFISQSENFSYRVKTSNGSSYVLRLHRPSYHSLAELESEQQWTEALLQAGIDVPIALRTNEGRRYSRVKCPDGWRYVGMLEWVEGRLLWDVISNSGEEQEQSHGRKDPYRLLGRLIAELHEQAIHWKTPENFSRHSLNVDGFVGESPFWGRFWETSALDKSHLANLVSMRNSIKEILVEYESSSAPYSLIHADLHASNVVVQGSRLHIIDFDDSGFGWHAYDLAVALHNLRDTQQYSLVKSSLISGYSDVRSLATEEIEMVELFLVVRSLASIGWISARPDLNRNLEKICQNLYDDARIRLKKFEH